jgi:hypothetical protein
MKTLNFAKSNFNYMLLIGGVMSIASLFAPLSSQACGCGGGGYAYTGASPCQSSCAQPLSYAPPVTPQFLIPITAYVPAGCGSSYAYAPPVGCNSSFGRAPNTYALGSVSSALPMGFGSPVGCNTGYNSGWNGASWGNQMGAGMAPMNSSFGRLSSNWNGAYGGAPAGYASQNFPRGAF